MDCTVEDRAQPAINITHLADRLLLASGSMGAFRHKLDVQNDLNQSYGLIPSELESSSRSSQFSDDGFATASLHDSGHELGKRNDAYVPSSQSMANTCAIIGFVKNEHSVFSAKENIAAPSPNACGDGNGFNAQEKRNGYSLQTERRRSDGQGVKSGRPKSRLSRPPLLPPCRVCEDRASGFHYGVNTCEACKGFFRRSINKTSEPYVCVGNGRCKLAPGKRTACSSCRYQRCLQVGMSKNAIKTGRYTHELRSKNIMEVKKLQMQNGIESPIDSVYDKASVAIETEETASRSPSIIEDRDLEELLLTLMEGQKKLYEYLDDYYNDELIQKRQLEVYTRHMTNKRNELLGGNIDYLVQHPLQVKRTNGYLDESSDKSVHVKDRMCVSNGGVRPCESNRTGGWLEQSLRYGNFFSQENKDNKNFSQMPLQRTSGFINVSDPRGADIRTRPDVDKGMNSNDMRTRPEVVKGDDCCEEKKKAEVLGQVLQDMEKGVQGLLSFSRCLPGFEDLPSEDQAALLKAARFDIWYVGHIRCFNTDLRVGACEWQFHAEELEKVWGESVVDLAFRLSARGQALNLSKEETAALRAVCLTFPDRCYPLTKRHLAEDLHERMLGMFRYVCSKRHRKFNGWFPKVVDFLTILREFGIIFEKASSCLKLDWTVLNENPYLLEVFLS